ncbi:MAG: RNA polymerase sigma factor [Crocinitomicaceae bacterium]|nr:RNA polymerase sigma factor [Crocinitomicaceae bacterium]
MFLFSEKSLVQQLKDPARREKAFGVVVKLHKEKIYWYIRRLVIDFDDAHDITQDVFIKAWEGLDYFQGKAQIYSWLFRIATNESLNHLRKRCRYEHIPIEKAGAYLLGRLENGPYISGEEISIRLEKEVAMLPEKQRVVFVLRYFEGWEYSEIAAITGTSEGALHASYHLAEKKIEKNICVD